MVVARYELPRNIFMNLKQYIELLRHQWFQWFVAVEQEDEGLLDEIIGEGDAT